MKTVILNDTKYIDDILEIENQCFSMPWTRGMFEDEFTKSIARYVGIAEDNGRLVAYGGFWKIFDEAHITNIAVAPNHRRQGIGKQIISEMTYICKSNGINKMTLEVRESNLAAILLYKKMGFTIDGRRKAYYEDNKEDALIMWANL